MDIAAATSPDALDPITFRLHTNEVRPPEDSPQSGDFGSFMLMRHFHPLQDWCLSARANWCCTLYNLLTL